MRKDASVKLTETEKVIRMQAAGKKPKRYKHFIQAQYKMVATAALNKSLLPSVEKAIFVKVHIKLDLAKAVLVHHSS